MPATIADEYRIERAAQDARFDSRVGAGSVDHTMTDADEYRAYFGLGEWAGSGVEVRLTFKAFLVARAAERRAAVEADRLARLAELPTHFLTALAGNSAIDAELERRLAAWDAEHESDAAFDVVAEVVEILEAAEVVEALEPVAPAARRVAPAARIARRIAAPRLAEIPACACSYTTIVCSYTAAATEGPTNDRHHHTRAGPRPGRRHRRRRGPRQRQGRRAHRP